MLALGPVARRCYQEVPPVQGPDCAQIEPLQLTHVPMSARLRTGLLSPHDTAIRLVNLHGDVDVIHMGDAVTDLAL